MDMITDMHQYFYGKRVALWGDPDQLVSLAEFLADLDMRPGLHRHRHARQAVREADGGGAGRPRARGQGPPGGRAPTCSSCTNGSSNEPVDLLIGNTYGKYIARDENIPFVRHGFPILDRVGHSYFPTVGYAGAMRLLEMILDALHGPQGPRVRRKKVSNW